MSKTLFDRILEDEASYRKVFQEVMHSADPEAMLREIAAGSVDRWRAASPLKSFDLVGATLMQDRSGLDAPRFYKLFLYLIRSGLPIDPNFTMHQSNFMYEEDYLKTTRTADVTVICNIPLGDPPYMQGLKHVDLANNQARFERAKAQFDRAMAENKPGDRLEAASDFNLFVSDKHTPEAWEERLQRCGSKLIISYYSGAEVNLNEMRLPGYSTLGTKQRGYDRVYETDSYGDTFAVRDIDLNCNCQVYGADSYLQVAIMHVRGHVDPTTQQPFKKPGRAGTEMGTAIYHRGYELAMAEPDTEMQADRPADDSQQQYPEQKKSQP